MGTSGARALAIDESGRVHADATASYSLETPRPRWAEQNPESWWRACCETIGRVVAAVPTGSIASVGLTGQMHGAVFLDAADRPIRPAILWCDGRADRECAEIERRLGADRLRSIAMNPALVGFTAPKVLWLAGNEPEAYARVRSLLLPKDFIRLRLTGERATDAADASGTLLLDVGGRCWSPALIAAADVESAWLPTVVESTSLTGRITAEASAATGLPIGTPVAAGAGDQAAGAVGSGVVRPGIVSVTVGSSGVVFAHSEVARVDPGGRVHTFCHAVPGAWHLMGVTLAAGLSLRWFRERFGVGADAAGDPYDRLTAEAASAEPGAEGLLFLPYLMGERTPHLDPHARAVLFGLTARHGRPEVVRAILEGVAFSLRDALEIFAELEVPRGEVRLAGGGARSSLWRSIQAAVFGQRCVWTEAAEGPAFGAALLASVGVGAHRSVEAACDAAVRVGGALDPDTALAARYDAAYARYGALYGALRDQFPRARESGGST